MPQDLVKSGGTNSKRKSPGTYFGDYKFLPRVKEYLEITKVRPDVEDVVDYLRESYPEYNRKKRRALKLTTIKALNTLDVKEDYKTSQLEERYLSKRQKRSRSFDDKVGDEDVSDGDSEFSLTENEELMEFKDTNVTNTSMQDLYRRTLKTPAMTETARNHLSANDLVTWKINKIPTLSTVLAENETTFSSNSLPLEQSNISKELRHVSRENVANSSTPVSANAKVTKTSLSAISEDEKSIPSRPSTPLNKSIAKSVKKRSDSVKQKRFAPSDSKVTFKDVGGCDSCLQEVSKLLLHLKHPEVFTQLGIKPPRGFLLHGAPGCGKTLLANAIAGELQLPYFKIAAPEVVSGISGDSEQTIRSLFADASAVAPSIIFIDEIDSITPKRENAGKEMERRVVTQILTCMDDLASSESHVLVIGATNRVDALDPALRRAGRFDREIAMGIPDKNARKQILKVICRDLKLVDEFDYDRIAAKTPGYVGADIQALAREAAMCAVDSAFKSIEKEKHLSVNLFGNDDNDETKTTGEESRVKEVDTTAWLREEPPLTEEQLANLFISTEHFELALPHVQPSAKREGFATVPDVSWEDIGALEDIREELTMAIMAPVQNPAEFEALGLTTPPGILLAGPPGCGKTLLAKAIANEAGINFISVKGPELLNMYVGESEKAVRQVFERARNSSPCVIFFDEIDALCPKRSMTGDSSASSRVVNQLLTEMDGLQARKQVFIMGATNRPDILDPAILRPGRLDKLLHVGLPDHCDRIQILNTITKNGCKPPLNNDVTVERLANDERCEGFSGADLTALVREASVAALKEFMTFKNTIQQFESRAVEPQNGSVDTTVSITNADGTMDVTEEANVEKSNEKIEKKCRISVSLKHFEVAFSKVHPSVTGKDRKWYEDLKTRHSRK